MKLRPVDRTAIIDIGSNSVRLIVLDGLSRSPVQEFSEQMYPHLGSRIARTGKLDPDGVETCLAGLQRYAMLCGAMGVNRKIVVATAAVREAIDGQEFIDKVRKRTGLDVKVVSGDEEGRLSALGVIAGIPSANGLVGDLGGGSLELALVSNGKVGERTTLPLGPFRLQRGGRYVTDRDKLVSQIDDHLSSVSWLGRARGSTFYPVGGNWRACAKVQMRREQYPIDLVHQHEMGVREGIELCALLSNLPPSSLTGFSVPKKRIELVPSAALVLERTLRMVKPKAMVFSGFGLREGLVYDCLSESEKARDPLIAACEAQGDRLYGKQVFAWTTPFFPSETAQQTRLRMAASLLSESGASENPAYRAKSAYDTAFGLSCGGLTHSERACLAYALYRRWDGSDETRDGKAILKTVDALASPSALRHADHVAAVLSFAGSVSAGVPSLLAGLEIRAGKERVGLHAIGDAKGLLTQPLMKRFEALARNLHLKPDLQQTIPMAVYVP
jgi:exopolyphosphatase/guanosine-5'-triphosphate,3'-diphosphate pyrophosphatase